MRRVDAAVFHDAVVTYLPALPCPKGTLQPIAWACRGCRARPGRPLRTLFATLDHVLTVPLKPRRVLAVGAVLRAWCP